MTEEKGRARLVSHLLLQPPPSFVELFEGLYSLVSYCGCGPDRSGNLLLGPLHFSPDLGLTGVCCFGFGGGVVRSASGERIRIFLEEPGSGMVRFFSAIGVAGSASNGCCSLLLLQLTSAPPSGEMVQPACTGGFTATRKEALWCDKHSYSRRIQHGTVRAVKPAICQ